MKRKFEEVYNVKNFVDVMKMLWKKCYKNQLDEVINLKNKKVIYLSPSFNDDRIKFHEAFFKHFNIKIDYICLPGDNAEVFFNDVTFLEMSTLRDFIRNEKERTNIVVFSQEDHLSSKFLELIAEFKLKYILPIGSPAGLMRNYNYIMDNMNDIFEIYTALDDDESKRAYQGHLYSLVSGSIHDYVFTYQEQYFFSKCLPKENDIVIDAGCYDGKTAEAFASLGSKVYSFELSKKNYEQTKAKEFRYPFVLENLGLSNRQGIVEYSESGGCSSIGSGKIKGEVIDLDSYVYEKSLPGIDFIKMDIEGAELNALIGASASISKWKPKMAICTYHNGGIDMWRLPKFIKSLRPDYQFFYRQHFTDHRLEVWNKQEEELLGKYGLDLFLRNRSEAVLYCR